MDRIEVKFLDGRTEEIEVKIANSRSSNYYDIKVNPKKYETSYALGLCTFHTVAVNDLKQVTGIFEIEYDIVAGFYHGKV